MDFGKLVAASSGASKIKSFTVRNTREKIATTSLSAPRCNLHNDDVSAIVINPSTKIRLSLPWGVKQSLTIYYTIDWTDPVSPPSVIETTANAVVSPRYQRPIQLEQPGEYQLRALSAEPKRADSEILYQTFTVKGSPFFSLL
jgi:hypothetical protein